MFKIGELMPRSNKKRIMSGLKTTANLRRIVQLERHVNALEGVLNLVTGLLEDKGVYSEEDVKIFLDKRTKKNGE